MTTRTVTDRIKKDLGADAARDFHDAKEGGIGDRTLEELRQDAYDLYEQAGKLDNMPPWMRPQ